MKKLILIGFFYLSASNVLNAQLPVSSIQNTGNELVINDSISIKKGDNIKVYLPVGKDFMFVKPVKKFNTKLLGSVANIASTGATAVGVGTGNLKVLTESMKVYRTASAVQYGVEALDKIQELPISNNAKKIAGKDFEVVDWNFNNDDGYSLNTKFENKTYQISLQEALITGEIKLNNEIVE
ncbi:hypothetical protein [Vaginella massiliensis]|uniref:hypothetical protein n=1 Tax=Vaginella massiliensis TaxID=1816680 RepID=UPI00083983EF|nr:hypothetical protein [Vaginella massiliensis]